MVTDELINEARMIRYVDSDFIVGYESIYFFQNYYWLCTEPFEGVELNKIIRARKGDLSEDFCKWSLK